MKFVNIKTQLQGSVQVAESTDGQHENSPKLKSRHLHPPLVVVWSQTTILGRTWVKIKHILPQKCYPLYFSGSLTGVRTDSFAHDRY